MKRVILWSAVYLGVFASGFGLHRLVFYVRASMTDDMRNCRRMMEHP